MWGASNRSQSLRSWLRLASLMAPIAGVVAAGMALLGVGLAFDFVSEVHVAHQAEKVIGVQSEEFRGLLVIAFALAVGVQYGFTFGLTDG